MAKQIDLPFSQSWLHLAFPEAQRLAHSGTPAACRVLQRSQSPQRPLQSKVKALSPSNWLKQACCCAAEH